MPTNEERLATLEESKIHMQQTLSAIWRYMEEGREWREETGKTLSTILNEQKSMSLYQVHCDADRDNIERDAIALEKRVTATEGYQLRQIKMVIMVSTAVGFLASGGAKLLTKAAEFFS